MHGLQRIFNQRNPKIIKINGSDCSYKKIPPAKKPTGFKVMNFKFSPSGEI